MDCETLVQYSSAAGRSSWILAGMELNPSIPVDDMSGESAFWYATSTGWMTHLDRQVLSNMDLTNVRSESESNNFPRSHESLKTFKTSTSTQVMHLYFCWVYAYICSLTLWASAASLTGTQLCFLCFCESRQIRQMSCWSSWQKSLSFSPCRLQSSSDAESALWLLSCLKASDRFLSARLRGGSPIGKISLQTGHVCCVLFLHQSRRQDLQKLWPHSKRTGSVKISQHTGQVHSTSDDDDALADILLIYPVAVWTFT